MKPTFIITLCGVFSSTLLFSQKKQTLPLIQFGNLSEKHRAWELGFSNGLVFYTGDVHSASIALKETHPCFGVYTYYHLTDNVSLRLTALYSQFTGSDLNYGVQHGTRNFTFRSNAIELVPSVAWEPWGHKKYNLSGGESRKAARISPYIHLGLGALLINPKVDYYEEGNINLTAQIAQDKVNTTKAHITIPFGVGWRYDISSQWTLGGEASLHAPFSDYLDGISQSANPFKRDWYSVATLNLGYRFKYKKDKDKDGTPDNMDDCPDLPGFPSAKGCPDRDADGVLDKEDLCPDDKGNIDLKGCPDQDADGVPDYEDHCPYNAGLKKAHGCPDRDKDGVVDYKDLCPDIAGSLTAKGCPDKDGDGIMDKQDKCPNDKGTLATDGCPTKDWDNDGVPDYADACPEKAGDKTNNGCPFNPPIQENKIVQKYTLQDPKNIAENKGDSLKTAMIKDNYYSETKNVMFANQPMISFIDNATKIKDLSYPALNNIVEALNKDTGARIEINIYNNDTKDKVLNKKLSEARGRTIYYFFIKNGINAERLRYKGHGDENIEEKITAEQNIKRKSVVEFLIF